MSVWLYSHPEAIYVLWMLQLCRRSVYHEKKSILVLAWGHSDIFKKHLLGFWQEKFRKIFIKNTQTCVMQKEKILYRSPTYGREETNLLM